MSIIQHITPPAAPEIEQAVIRSLILEGNSAFDELGSSLLVPLFYNQSNAAIFQCMVSMHRSHKTIDLLTVSDELIKIDPELSAYLGTLISSGAPMAMYESSLSDYLSSLYEHFVKREIIQSIYKLHAKMVDPLTSADEAIALLSQTVNSLSEIRIGQSAIPSFDALFNLSYKKLQQRIEASSFNKLSGIETGLSKLNEMLAGWQPGDLIVLAARPGMGKTALALFFAHMAAKSNAPALFFSLEMAAYRLADRLIIGQTGIDAFNYRHGRISNAENEMVYNHADHLQNLPLYIDEKASPDIDYLIGSSRLAVRKLGVNLIIIDYLQLIDMREQKGQTRDQAIGNVTRRLKQLAKELSVPVILLSQLNRSLEARQNKLPTLSDLRESGNIEQDADIVLLLYRPAYYGLTEFRDKETYNVLWVLTEKYRDGDPKDIVIKHNSNLTKFNDYE